MWPGRGDNVTKTTGSDLILIGQFIDIVKELISVKSEISYHFNGGLEMMESFLLSHRADSRKRPRLTGRLLNGLGSALKLPVAVKEQLSVEVAEEFNSIRFGIGNLQEIVSKIKLSIGIGSVAIILDKADSGINNVEIPRIINSYLTKDAVQMIVTMDAPSGHGTVVRTERDYEKDQNEGKITPEQQQETTRKMADESNLYLTADGCGIVQIPSLEVEKENDLFAMVYEKPKDKVNHEKKVDAFIKLLGQFIGRSIENPVAIVNHLESIRVFMKKYLVFELSDNLIEDLTKVVALPAGERLEIVGVEVNSSGFEQGAYKFIVKNPSADGTKPVKVINKLGVPRLEELFVLMTAPVVSASIERFISVVSRLININSQKQRQEQGVVTSQPGEENPVNTELAMIRQYLSRVCSLYYSSPNRPVLSQDLLDELSSIFNLPEEELEKLRTDITKILRSDKYGLEQFNNTTGIIRAALKNNFNIEDRVVLSGLKTDEFNGKSGVIVAPGWTTGSNGGARLTVKVDGKDRKFRIKNLSKQVDELVIEPVVEAAAGPVSNHGLSCDDVRKGCVSAAEYCGSLFSGLLAKVGKEEPDSGPQAGPKKTN